MADDIDEILKEIPEESVSQASIDDDHFDDSEMTDENLDAMGMSRKKFRHVINRKIESGRRRGRLEAMQEMNAQNAVTVPAQENSSSAAYQSAVPQQQGGMTEQQAEQFFLRKEQERQQQQQYQMLEQINQKFVSEILAAEDKYPGISDKVSKLGLRSHGAQALVVGAVNSGNAVEIMKELAEDPTKYVNFVRLFEEAPEAAKERLAALSQSIQLNQSASQAAKSNIDEPLSRIRSSISANSSDNGERSINDWEKWLNTRR